MIVWPHNEASAMSTVVLCNLQSPELVARLQKIRAMQEQQEYDRMVRNIDPTVSEWHAWPDAHITLMCAVQVCCNRAF